MRKLLLVEMLLARLNPALKKVACRGGASVQHWAEYVRQHATFMAPLADEQAAVNLAGLPVPFLVVANKADLKG